MTRELPERGAPEGSICVAAGRGERRTSWRGEDARLIRALTKQLQSLTYFIFIIFICLGGKPGRTDLKLRFWQKREIYCIFFKNMFAV